MQILRPLVKELLLRGHSVTTVRFAMEQELLKGNLGVNHTEVILYQDNSEGIVDFVTKEVKGVSQFDGSLNWRISMKPRELVALWICFNQWVASRKMVCNALLENEEAVSQLRSRLENCAYYRDITSSLVILI